MQETDIAFLNRMVTNGGFANPLLHSRFCVSEGTQWSTVQHLSLSGMEVSDGGAPSQYDLDFGYLYFRKAPWVW